MEVSPKSIKSVKKRHSTGALKQVVLKDGQVDKTKKDLSKKSKPKVPSSDNTATTNICVEGMTSGEFTMIRRLAGNDPIVRKKTVRKLKKWLIVLSQKVPDTADSRRLIEPNFIRVWKALFYCMWMADKPLPQEQLAEGISNLQVIFASKTSSFLLFVEWFIRTIAREWNWIDRFRMDKFMMLFRRFIRKSLVILSEKKWSNDMLLGYLNIISSFIFNHHALPKGKKPQDRPAVVPTPAPLGLQIHFIDIFMEELAKVGRENIKFQKTLKILSIFICELASNNDDRILGEIRERIFNHLMKQSDVGIDYQELLAFGDQDEDVEQENDCEDTYESDDADLAEGNMDDTEEDNFDDGVLDPRAGAVDVVLPQLDIDYEKLYQKLIECGGHKDVKLKNRRILYSIAQQFKELTEGKYPLALPEDNVKARAIPRKEIENAAKRLLELENTGESKRRKTKKERKRDAKKKLNWSVASAESAGSEDHSQYINDEEILDHVTDNYMSYINTEISDNSESHCEDKTDSNSNEIINGDALEATAEKAAKKENNRKRKWKTVVEVEADEVVGDAVPKGGLKQNTEEVVVIKKPKKIKKRDSLGSSIMEKEKPTTPLLGKNRRLSELKTPKNKLTPRIDTPSSSASKRVSFILARNLEHPHADYPVSIARSPAIPFDKNRRPSFGLLKSPGTTPKSTPIKRAAALDFF